MIEVDGDTIAGIRVVHQDEPFDDVALDGVGEIVDGAGAVGETEVDHRSSMRCGGGVAPEEIGGVKIVVRPERSE